MPIPGLLAFTLPCSPGNTAEPEVYIWVLTPAGPLPNLVTLAKRLIHSEPLFESSYSCMRMQGIDRVPWAKPQVRKCTVEWLWLCLTWSHKCDFSIPTCWKGSWHLLSISYRLVLVSILPFHPYHNLLKWGSLSLFNRRQEMRFRKTKRGPRKVPNDLLDVDGSVWTQLCLKLKSTFVPPLQSGPGFLTGRACAKQKHFHGSPCDIAEHLVSFLKQIY